MVLHLSRHIIFMTAVLMSICSPLCLHAGGHEEDIYEMSLDENLETPEIKNSKHAEKVQNFQYDMAVAFNVLAAEKGIEFKMIADSRDREHFTIITEK